MAKKSGKVYEAREAFVADIDGQPMAVAKGDRVREGHPLLKGRKDLFQESEPEVQFDVEDASADPGRKRGDDDKK
jgi:hypothetical protein